MQLKWGVLKCYISIIERDYVHSCVEVCYDDLGEEEVRDATALL
jgi:hypothetical protein